MNMNEQWKNALEAVVEWGEGDDDCEEEIQCLIKHMDKQNKEELNKLNDILDNRKNEDIEEIYDVLENGNPKDPDTLQKDLFNQINDSFMGL